MTFNIQHARNYLEDHIDFPLFIKAIGDIDPDICGLNEVRGRGVREGYTAQTETLASALDMHGIFGCSAMIGGNSAYGNAVLSKTPAKDMRVIPIEQTVKGAEPRSVLRVDLGELVVYQTHLGLKESELYKGAETVYALLKEEQKPAVLMGDFNLRPDHPALEKMLADPDITHADTGYTFPSDLPDRKIDYIFVNKGAELVSAYVPEPVSYDRSNDIYFLPSESIDIM